MKKTLIAVAGIALAAMSTFAQGTVTFGNSATGLVTRATSAADSTQISISTGNGGGKVELLWAPVGTTDVTQFNPVAGSVTSVGVPLAGRFSNATTFTIPAGSGFSGIAPGAIAAFVVRGWQGSSADWATASGLWNAGTIAAGYSAIFNVKTGDPTTTPPGTPGSTSPLFPATGLQFVPEPTGFALMGLGLAAMLIRRRK